MSLRVTKKLRFDDSDVAPDGYCYAGFNFLLTDDHREYCVRLYDDEPGSATVIEPDDIVRLPEARSVVDFITAELGCSRVSFYCDGVGHYRQIDLASLEFRTEKSQEAEQDIASNR